MRKLALLFIAVLTLAGCVGTDIQPPEGRPESAPPVSFKDEILAEGPAVFGEFEGSLVNGDFLDWLGGTYGDDCLSRLYDSIANGRYTDAVWSEITGYTAKALECFYSGALDPDDPDYRENLKIIGDGGGERAVIRVTGDFSLADNWDIMPQYERRGEGLEGVLSAETIEVLRTADVTLVNNEFTYSRRGSPIKGKAYTFRADPRRVSLFGELGVDIVSLANNHAYDFGPDAFADTLDTLKSAGIAYIGGGADIAEASRPFYFIVGGRVIAFTAATRAEKYILTPEATDSSSGVLRTYDPEKYVAVIEEAAAHSDYCIAYVHWGREGSHEIEDGLREMGARFIDAGADIVVGAHAHLLQGIEYYAGRPIVFNLGNFLFNAKTMDTGILELSIGGAPEYRFIPCVQSGCYTKIVTGDESARILRFMSSLSSGVSFGEDGVFCEDTALS